jgi:hypothetical protein
MRACAFLDGERRERAPAAGALSDRTLGARSGAGSQRAAAARVMARQAFAVRTLDAEAG